MTAGFIDQVAIREDLALKKSSSGNSYESSRNVAYRATGLVSQQVYIHPSSVLFHTSPPDYLVFQDVIRNSNGKTWLKGVTKINPTWLVSLGKSQCSFSKPVEMPGSGVRRMDVVKGDTREVFVIPHFRDLGVDLPAVKKTQKREGTRWLLLD